MLYFTDALYGDPASLLKWYYYLLFATTATELEVTYLVECLTSQILKRISREALEESGACFWFVSVDFYGTKLVFLIICNLVHSRIIVL